MGLDFSAGELAQLFDIVAGVPTDILLKTDQDGFIVQASQGIEYLGAAMPDMLVPPHLLDLVAPRHVRRIEAYFELAMGAGGNRSWTEFTCALGPDAGRWFALQLQPARAKSGMPAGTIGVLRNVDERRQLEDKLFTARMTDPITGLTNRIAFLTMLRHMADHSVPGCLAVLTIEHFRAINHRLGQDFGDDLLAAFSKVLRSVMRQGDILSRIGDAAFAVLLPGSDDATSADLCRQVQGVFADEIQLGKLRLPLAAAAGIAEIGSSADDTLCRAEMAAFLDRSNFAGSTESQRMRPRPLPRTTYAAAAQDRPRLAG